MPGYVSKYASLLFSIIVHSAIFILFYIAARNYNPNANGLIEFNLFEESGGGNGGGSSTVKEEPEEKINTNEKKTEEKSKPLPKPSPLQKETSVNVNQTGETKGTGTGTGTGSGIGKSGISLGVPLFSKPKEEIYLVAVDEMPEPLGGFDEINSKVVVPEQAKQKQITGTVFVLAFIDQYGVVRKTMLTKGIGYGCDGAAMSAVSRTRFRPGKQNGVPEKVQMQIPVSIR